MNFENTTLCLSPVLTYRTDILFCRIALHSVCCIFLLDRNNLFLAAAFLPARRSFLTTTTHPSNPNSIQKKAPSPKKNSSSPLQNSSVVNLSLEIVCRLDCLRFRAQTVWSKGPPQTASAPTPRSYSPAPSTPVQTHSRCPSALGQGVPMYSSRQRRGRRHKTRFIRCLASSLITYWFFFFRLSRYIWVDRWCVCANIIFTRSRTSRQVRRRQVIWNSSSNSWSCKWKASISSRSSIVATSSSSTPATSSTSSAPSKPAKMDILKMFQNPSSASSSRPPSDTSSPSMRSASLPPQQPPQLGQSAPTQQSQLGSHSYTAFVPRQQQNSGPGEGPLDRLSIQDKHLTVQALTHRVGQILAPPLVYQAHDLGIIPQRSTVRHFPTSANATTDATSDATNAWLARILCTSHEIHAKNALTFFQYHPISIICPNITGIQCLRKCPRKHLINTPNITFPTRFTYAPTSWHAHVTSKSASSLTGAGNSYSISCCA